MLISTSMDLSMKDDTPSNTYLEQDRWDSDRVNIKSEYGVTEGYIKPDSWEPDRLNIYDWYGIRKIHGSRKGGIFIKVRK